MPVFQQQLDARPCLRGLAAAVGRNRDGEEPTVYTWDRVARIQLYHHLGHWRVFDESGHRLEINGRPLLLVVSGYRANRVAARAYHRYLRHLWQNDRFGRTLLASNRRTGDYLMGTLCLAGGLVCLLGALATLIFGWSPLPDPASQGNTITSLAVLIFPALTAAFLLDLGWGTVPRPGNRPTVSQAAFERSGIRAILADGTCVSIPWADIEKARQGYGPIRIRARGFVDVVLPPIPAEARLWWQFVMKAIPSQYQAPWHAERRSMTRRWILFIAAGMAGIAYAAERNNPGANAGLKAVLFYCLFIGIILAFFAIRVRRNPDRVFRRWWCDYRIG